MKSPTPVDPARYHLVGVRDATSNQIQLYVDDKLAATTTGGAACPSTGPLTVGRAQEVSGLYADEKPRPAAHMKRSRWREVNSRHRNRIYSPRERAVRRVPVHDLYNAVQAGSTG
ncbi:hypothetical protein [Streptomyces cupreus]|uniref:LamG domain-containing protein n=1 Tax=Streptomyces cupreus TaxID=2759956 RepID=A0A7X1MAM4_9ACTN|nr:hypothetical protein [Streptomyces cupreus]MBC2904297.1 hypothetical protein [Streptomyces cupreus]